MVRKKIRNTEEEEKEEDNQINTDKDPFCLFLWFHVNKDFLFIVGCFLLQNYFATNLTKQSAETDLGDPTKCGFLSKPGKFGSFRAMGVNHCANHFTLVPNSNLEWISKLDGYLIAYSRFMLEMNLMESILPPTHFGASDENWVKFLQDALLYQSKAITKSDATHKKNHAK